MLCVQAVNASVLLNGALLQTASVQEVCTARAF